jgi:glycosyltransferase involved in cell wall biosynthesis
MKGKPINAAIYNQAQFIERSILSVLNQNYANTEFIIVDGGSTDGTVQIIKNYQEYLTYWVSEPDRGQSQALNKGFAHASGDIFGWLNSDDLYLPGTFCYVAEVFAKYPAKRIVHGDYLTIDVEDKIISREYAFDFSLNQFKFEGFHLNAQAMFWRRCVHESFGEFDEHLYNTMDYEMILRFGISEGEKSFLRVPVPLSCFRRHSAQKTRGFTQRVIDEHRLMAKKHGYTVKYSTLGTAIRLLYRFRRAYWYTKRGGLSYATAKCLGWF